MLFRSHTSSSVLDALHAANRLVLAKLRGRQHKGKSSLAASRTRSPAHAVRICARGGWQVEVENTGDVGEVDSPCNAIFGVVLSSAGSLSRANLGNRRGWSGRSPALALAGPASRWLDVTM